MEEAVSALGINGPVLLAQLVQFIILLGLLYLVAYKPIMRIMDERSRRIKESIDQTEQIKQQAEQAEVAYQQRLEVAGQEGQELINRATRAGEELKKQAQADAKKEAETLIARAKAEIQQERDEAVGELRKEFSSLTIMAAEKVIDRSLDERAHRELIDKVLEESSGLKKG